jgi:peptide/nickel transport system substrate-binding protein
MRRRQFLAAGGALVVSAALAGCGGGSATTTAKGGGTFTIGMSLDATSWDLAKAGNGNEAEYYQPVFDTLVRLTPAGEPTPNLAAKWSYDDKQTTLTLTLRDGVKFTDGKALDAEAVKTSLLHNKASKQAAGTELAAITDVTAVDATTVKVTLSEPDPSLLAAFGQVPGMIASPAALDAASGPVGSGPYVLDKSGTTAGRQYTYTRNKDYWNAKAFPYDKIVILMITDPAARFNALQSGQLDWTTISADRMAAAKAAGLTIATSPGATEGLYIWDRGGKLVPALANVKVRQALNYAFDRGAIVKTVKKDLGTSTVQLFNEGSAGYDKSLDGQYSYDPAKAKQLLAEAGYPNGFAVTIPDLSANFPQEQAALNQALADIGLKVKTVPVPLNQLFSTLLAGKYAMSYFKLSGAGSWDMVTNEVTKNALWNPFHYSDSKVDDLVSQIRAATGDAQDKLFQQLNAYLVEQAWNAPWDVLDSPYAMSKKITMTPQTTTMFPPIYNFEPAS